MLIISASTVALKKNETMQCTVPSLRIGLVSNATSAVCPDVPMIASVGLLVLMQDAFRIVFGEQGITFRSNTYRLMTYEMFGLTVNAVQIAIVVCAGVIFLGLHLFTTRTRIENSSFDDFVVSS